MNLRVRSKNYKKYYYCIIKKKEINLNDCFKCYNKEYKDYKPIKKVSSKRVKLERERYSIITSDFSKCFVCGSNRGHIDINEVFEGSNRNNSMKYGMCVPLCRKCHMRFHNDIEFNLKFKRLFQEEFEKFYTREEFMNIFGKNYL